MSSTRCSLFTDTPLHAGATVALPEDQAHYLRHVLRASEGEAVALFNGRDGEWHASITSIGKKHLHLHCQHLLRAQKQALPVTVCFAPVKGGRVEEMVEKATELGALRIQPIKTSRTIVANVNPARLQLVAREAAEQSGRLDVPEICPMLTLPQLLAEWPEDTPLFYGDESGVSEGFLFASDIAAPASPTRRFAGSWLARSADLAPPSTLHSSLPTPWGTLTGPEGGFTPEEFALLHKKKQCVGVALGPRILRADTACITLLAITAQALGDWHERPNYRNDSENSANHSDS